MTADPDNTAAGHDITAEQDDTATDQDITIADHDKGDTVDHRKRYEIVDDLVEELRECEYGTVTTLSKLLKATGHDDPDLDEEELRILWDVLGTAGNACRVYIDWRMSKDRKNKPVEDLEFMVYNKNATVKCPRCSSSSTARILYGSPCAIGSGAKRPHADSLNAKRPHADNPRMAELRRRIEAGKVVPGGGVLFEVPMDGRMVTINPARRCADCGKEFGGPPLIVAKDYLSAEDYRDVVTKVEFTAYETFGAYTKITVIKNDRGAMATVCEDPYASGEVQSRQVDEHFWNSLMYHLYRRIYLKDWNKNYDGPFGRQGARWELRLGMTGRRQRNYHGSNVLTPYFKELMQIMMRAF